MPLRTFADCDDVFERNLVKEVTGQGWSVVHAAQPPGRSEIPNLAYTVGLWSSSQHPEVLVFGLSPQRSQALLRLVSEAILAGRVFTAEGDYEGLLEGLKCRFQPFGMQHHRDYLQYCRWFYRGDGFQAVQLLWPDSQGIFPGHSDFEASLSPLQPVLIG